MLDLLLLRHAKSSWGDPTLPDHQRSLTKRGTKAASRMGRYIVDNNLQPDLILCSDAVRARATLALVVSFFDDPLPDTVTASDLYLAEPNAILRVIEANAANAGRILVVGHNPGLQALALSLTGSSKRRDLQQMAMKFPTAALAHLRFDTSDWSEITTASATLQAYAMPRALTD